jgi:protocatechuate 3,4-dioxygenase beta subunit
MAARIPAWSIAAGAATLALGLYLLFGPGSGARPESREAGSPQNAPSPDGAQAGKTSQLDLAEATQGRSVAVKPQEGIASLPAASGEALRLKGQVLCSAPLPEDERARVQVFRRKTSAGSERWDERFGDADEAGEDGAAAGTPDPGPEIPLAEAEVAPDGSFELALTLEEPSTEELFLGLEGRYLFAPQRLGFDPLNPPLRGLQLFAELGARLVGRVSEASDVQLCLGQNPRAGFETSAVADLEWRRWARTDPAGRFELTGIPAGRDLLLVTRALGRAPESSELDSIAPGETRTHDLSLPPGGGLSGQVLDDLGLPLSGARVEIQYSGTLRALVRRLGRAETDAEGRFRFESLPAVALRLRASREGLLSITKSLDPLEGERPPVTLVLSAGEALRGRIVCDDPIPLAELEVTASPDLASMTMGPGMARWADFRAEARTDGEGLFRLLGMPGDGRFVLTVEREQDGQITHRGRLAGQRPGSAEALLRLVPTRTLVGRVVDQLEQPIPAFELRLEQSGGGLIPGLGRIARREAVEDAEGRFSLPGLAAEVWEFSVSAAGYSRSEVLKLDLSKAGALDPIEVVLSPAPRVSGRVLSPLGQPVAGANVRRELGLIEMMASGGASQAAAITDASGRFEILDLDAGTCQLVASREGFASSEPLVLDVGPGQEYPDLLLTLRQGAKLSGEVLGDDGRPRASGTVVLQRMPNMTRQILLQTDSEGRFVQENLEPGSWQVTAMQNLFGIDTDVEQFDQAELLRDMKLEMVELAEGDSKHIVLGGTSGDQFEVVGKLTHLGEPVPGAMLSFVATSGKSIEKLKFSTSDEAGRFRIQLNGAGQYLVTVQLNVSMGQQEAIETKLQLEPNPEGPLEIEIELGRGRIEGRVVGVDGEPLADVRVSLKTDGGMLSGSFMGGHYVESKTDEEGRYGFDYLRPGQYQVAAGGALMGGALGGGSAFGRLVRSGLRLPTEGSLSGIDFRLEPSSELEGLVRDSAGQPVAGAALFVRNQEGVLVEPFSMTTSDAAGRFRMPGLAPGLYTVSAQKGALVSPESEPISVGSQGPGRVEVTLTGGSLLYVSVVDDQGDSVDATISIRDSFGREHSGRLSMQDFVDRMQNGLAPDEQSFGPLPPGDYTITATASDGRSKSKALNLAGQPERRLKLHMR